MTDQPEMEIIVEAEKTETEPSPLLPETKDFQDVHDRLLTKIKILVDGEISGATANIQYDPDMSKENRKAVLSAVRWNILYAAVNACSNAAGEYEAMAEDEAANQADSS